MLLPTGPQSGAFPRAQVIAALRALGCTVWQGFDPDEFVIEDETGDIEVQELLDPVPYKMIQYLMRKFSPDRLIVELRLQRPLN